MKTRWDEALRSLARRSQGPFRVQAYGVAASPEEEAQGRSKLEGLLQAEGFPSQAPIVLEIADPALGALKRPRFQDLVKGMEELSPTTPEEERGGEDARERLRALATELDLYLGNLRAGPRAAVSRPAGPGLVPETPGPRTRGFQEIPLLLVGCLEDLGSDAEAIGAAAQAILLRGAHLLLPPEGIDTRTREGRGRAALLLRLGGIKAAGARERSLRELGRRRQGLEVYGPIPFGFERQGQKLVPVPVMLGTVFRARDLAARGISFFEIALHLNREERSWKDGSSWTGRRVQMVLRNSIYDLCRREEIA